MISVIVPVYNVERYVERCICSILSQTFCEFELILVDDGSTDKSGDICDIYEKKDDRIRVFHQKNQGLSGARNAGTKLAMGEYIAYIDSDDSIEPEYLEELYSNVTEYKASVSVCGYVLEWESNGCKQKKKKEVEASVQTLTGRAAAQKIVEENDRKMITAWGKLYHKELKPLLLYPRGKTHEDEFVTYRVYYEAEKVVVSERKLYHYLQRDSSIMNNGYSEKRLDKLTALKEAVEYFEAKKDEELTRSAKKRYLLNLAIAWYRMSMFMPERKDLLLRIRKEWQESYKRYRKNIKSCISMTDWITLRVFYFSPYAYRIIAGIYEKIYREV